ncbi:MAG: addiction module toxin RelE [Candidatus Aquicultor secundus]|uniref:type II toxin-antitoxin system RelE family toxin n=1 Tax=Candidatus Aquicultor secundus TaxID=1973895 RepID=UPI000CCA50B4|nr:type II toxin-antitoxin system RelE/ParE family toxin [Candidatus Aquicultor secundus]PIW23049.1 MAG: addiction module toxin RelE [Candidatus Aquicultor secundus]PIY40476.1 MAG: addiction module toxin RelE [Candidatus Aquicultor secundus]PJB76487.1 MAG: addiction module toxin RelE [Candidatus Aquicultor secundus]
MAKEYRLVPSKLFLKDLEKLPADIKPRVEKTLLELKKDPHSTPNIKKLRNVDIGEWRLRIGDWRLRYDVVGNDILLHIIRQRKDVYKNK